LPGKRLQAVCRKITAQQDRVSQVATDLEAGSRVTLQAGKNLATISSRITAGTEAYLVAGDQLNLLAAQDSDYSLYDYKKKGSFGSQKTQRDEVTDVRNVGSKIKTGGDLLLVSGGDQKYQAAKLESGEDLTFQSGGAVTFEGVKDLHQESHEKSNNNAFWVSSKGKGKTDETLRQTELVAAANLTINAVSGLTIDIKQINQSTVSQTIETMVKADPQLAWLKDAERRGDVDWRQVKEIHDSFKYNNSGLGPASQLAIAIVMAAVVGPMAMGAVGTATTGAVAAGTIGANTATFLAVSAGAVATGAATNATVSLVNNRGDLGAVFKDVTSSGAMKGYLTSAAMAGIMPGYDPASLGFDLVSAQTVLMKSASDAFVNTVINGGSYSDNLGAALTGQASNIGMAVGFKMVGDWALGNYQDGTPQKVMAHALMGGLLAEATGGDFKTGAIAAGANEALISDISTMVGGDKDLELMVSQLTGLIAAAAVGGDVGKGAELAKYATTYNRQLHLEEQRWLEDNAQAFADKQEITKQAAMERLSQQALRETDMLWRSLLSDGTDNAAQAFLASSGQTFINQLGNKQALFTAEGNQLFRPEMFADTTNTTFYKQFVQSGINRDLSAGLVKELRDSGVALKDSAVDLVAAATANPGAAVEGLLKGIQELPQSVVDGFRESGAALGEGAAVAFNDELSAKLNAIYGVDVEAAQQSLLLVRAVNALMGASAGGKVAEALTAKLDDVLAKSVAKAESGKGTRDLADIDLGAPGPCCFAAGTKVSTPEGDRAIDQLKVGDIVWSKPEKGGKPFAARVLVTHVRHDQPIYRLKLKSVSEEGSTETLLVTPGHPFYVPAKNGFIPVIDLKPGDRLQSLADGATENTSSEVESLELYASVGTTYNLTVDVGHTFYVGNLRTWVHNTGPCALPERGAAGGEKEAAGTAAAGETKAAPPEATFPDEVFTGKKPHQTTPGVQSVTQEMYNAATGKLESSVIEYDQYGRQVKRTDYTNHGYGNPGKPTEYHSDPHTHTYEYGPGYGSNGKETRINHD
jgi:filamentous hemagglutinin